jgi:hypothetical protein
MHLLPDVSRHIELLAASRFAHVYFNPPLDATLGEN